MPKVSTISPVLKPFVWHGMALSDKRGQTQAEGDCPFCQHSGGKWYVDVESSKWDCKRCLKSGNSTSFLSQLHEASLKSTRLDDYQALATERKLLSSDTLSTWKVCKSIITGEWLVPGYGVEGNLLQIYRYIHMDGKRRLLATPTLSHQLCGVNLYQKAKTTVWLTEGIWDAMALWEVLRISKKTSGGSLELTGNTTINLLASANVLAAPGCGVFDQSWAKLLGGKKVILCYDNDKAGMNGMQRVAGILANSKDKPESISYVNWSAESGLADGYDVRDYLSRETK